VQFCQLLSRVDVSHCHLAYMPWNVDTILLIVWCMHPLKTIESVPLHVNVGGALKLQGFLYPIVIPSANRQAFTLYWAISTEIQFGTDTKFGCLYDQMQCKQQQWAGSSMSARLHFWRRRYHIHAGNSSTRTQARAIILYTHQNAKPTCTTPSAHSAGSERPLLKSRKSKAQGRVA
jgi:hypothetical protein